MKEEKKLQNACVSIFFFLSFFSALCNRMPYVIGRYGKDNNSG